MSKNRNFVKCSLLLMGLAAIMTLRGILYDALYGFDDQKSYRADVWEWRIRSRLNPNDAYVHYMIATTLSSHMEDCDCRSCRLNQSIYEYKEAIRVNPQYQQAYFELAGLYEAEFNDYTTANMFYQKCVDINPASPVYQSFLAQSFQVLGNQKQADLHWYLARRLQ